MTALDLVARLRAPFRSVNAREIRAERKEAAAVIVRLQARVAVLQQRAEVAHSKGYVEGFDSGLKAHGAERSNGSSA